MGFFRDLARIKANKRKIASNAVAIIDGEAMTTWDILVEIVRYRGDWRGTWIVGELLAWTGFMDGWLDKWIDGCINCWNREWTSALADIYVDDLINN